MKLPNIALILTILVSVIVLFTIVGTTAKDINEASDQLGYGNNCSLYTELTFNTAVSTDNCTNSTTGVASPQIAEFNQLPIAPLFRRTGVITLIIMLGIFIGGIVLIRKLK